MTTILAHFGTIDVLVNCAGGNVASATLQNDASPFTVPLEAYRQVVDLNFGTLLPNAGLRRGDARPAGGSIVNISSMAAAHALTRVAGYAAAKAAIETSHARSPSSSPAAAPTFG